MTDGSDDAVGDPVPVGTDEAIAAAAERAQHTADKNVPVLPGLPLPDDTANLREGPDLHPSLLAVLPLVGVWRGLGEGHDPESGHYHFGQQIIVGHDGGNYLTWESRSWIVDDDAKYLTPDLRESGFWRIGPGDIGEGPDVVDDESIEFLVAHAEGWVELFYGRPLTQTSWELATDVVITSATGSASGRTVGGAKRLYGLVEDGDLAYVEERIDADGDLVPRLSAKLARYIG